MFDLTQESPIRLTEAARLAGRGRGGKPIHFSTVLRWILTGVRSPTGEQIRLEAVRMGCHWVTSRQALRRFSERLTPKLSDIQQPSPHTSARRRRSREQAAKQLDTLGF